MHYQHNYNTWKNINFTVKENPNNIQISTTQHKALKFIKKRFIDGFLTTNEDLEQFVKSRNPKARKAATRRFTKRLVDSGAVERLDNGVFIPKGYHSLLKEIDTKTLSKIKSKRQRNSIVKAQNQFLSIVKPIVADNQNKWSFPLTQITVKFNINGLYKKTKELNIFEKRDKYYIIPFRFEEKCNNTIFGFNTTFQIYKNKVILKLGDQDYPIHANVNNILTAISICQKYLKWTNRFWGFNLTIPHAREWTINIPSIYTMTINPDYSKFGESIKNKTLGYELADNGNCLLLKQKLYLSNLKPSQLIGLFNKFYPLNILNLSLLKILQNPLTKVTLSNRHEKNNSSELISKSHASTIFLEKSYFNNVESKIIQGEKVQ